MSKRDRKKHIRTFDEAFALGQSILQDLKQTKQTESLPWEMSVPALRNTLHYLMDYLNHPCYMLCHSIQGKKRLVKLETGKTSAMVREALKTVKTMNAESEKKRQEILKDMDKKAYRIMQCIVKPYSHGFSAEYEEWVKHWPLPPGVYILNLTDANLLRKDGREPFPNAFVGHSHPHVPNHISLQPILPIMSMSGHVDYWDIPIPTYDDLFYVFPLSPSNAEYNQLRHQESSFVTDWTMKQNKVPIFRGSTTGCGVTPETNQRMRLVAFADGKPGKQISLDVGFTQGMRGKVKLDPVHGLAVTRTPDKLVAKKPMLEQSLHKYILHVDGNVLAYRLLYSMLTGSLLLRVKSPYQSFVDVTQALQPGVHYLEIAEDLSNLEKTIQWCHANDAKAAKIAQNGRMAAQEIMTPAFMKLYFYLTHPWSTNKKNNRHIVTKSRKVGGVYRIKRQGQEQGKRQSYSFMRMTRSTRKRRLSS